MKSGSQSGERIAGAGVAPTRPRRGTGQTLAVIAVIAGSIAIGLLVLSRFIAETRGASLFLAAAWIALCAIATIAFAVRQPQLRSVALASLAVTLAGVGVVGYWTGFRETTVNEQVISATANLGGVEREAALAGSSETESGPARGAADSSNRKRKPKPEPAGPVSLAAGAFVGVDGHDGTGKAEVIDDGGDRTLTFTDFDVDPGPQIEVYLTTAAGEVSDRIELGGLKGTRGNQQYPIPNGANLSKYDTVVLYCVPFTVRVAVAELG